MTSRTEPHARHLVEMRANRNDVRTYSHGATFRCVIRYTGAEESAARAIAAVRDLERSSDDPTRRHLMEMRLSVFEQRHADGLIDAREVNARRPDGARRLLAAARLRWSLSPR